MGDLIPLLSLPDSGYSWVAREVLTPAGPRVALLQEPLPQPPTWQDALLGEVGYGEGALTTCFAVAMLWKRIARLLRGLSGHD